MAFDIITVAPTFVDGAQDAGDVIFNLTSFQIPSRACKLVNIFMEVSAGGGEDDTKIGVLFFQKNDQATLGTINATANISASDFVDNKYIGQAFLALSDESAGLDLDIIDNTALYYGTSPFANVAATALGSTIDPVVLKGDSGNTDLYMGGVLIAGAPDFDGTANVKIHLHVEY